MSGILIDVDTRANSAKKDLNELNKNLAELVKKSTESNSSLNKISTNSFKNIGRDLNNSLKSFNNIKSVGTASLNAVDTSAKTLSNTIVGLKNSVITLGTAFIALKGVSYFNKVADDLTKIQNRISLATSSAEELVKTQTKIYQVAKEARATFADTANIYVDFSKALENTNYSQNRILSVTKTIQQAAVLSGSSAEAVKGAMVQLTQGIASGTLRGEELNSVMEQMKYLGQGIQTVLGKNAGSLRKFAEEGGLTTEVLLEVIEKLGEKTQADFNKTSITVESAAARIKQSIDFLFADINQYFGSSARLGKLLNKLSLDIDTFALNFRGTADSIRRSVYNYIAQFDLLDAAELTIKGLLRFEISPLDAYSKYSAYKEIKKRIAEFRKGTLDSKDLISELSLSVELFTLDTDATSGKSDKIIQSVKNTYRTILNSTKELLGKLLLELQKNPFTDFFVVTVENWLSLVPILRGPIQTIASSIRQVVRGLVVDLNAYLYDAIIPIARQLEMTAEYVTGFIVGDNRIERAWVQLLKSTSIVNFTENLRELNAVRRDIKYNDLNFVFKELNRDIRGVAFVIQDALVALNLMDNTIIKIRDSRLDRVIKYFQTFGTVLKRVYEDVFATTVEPIVFKIYFAILAVFETLTDAIEDTFTRVSGEELAENLVRGFKNAINFFKSKAIDISINLKSRDYEDSFKNIRKISYSLSEFLKGFFSKLGEELFEAFGFKASSSFLKGVDKAFKDGVKTIRSKLESLIDKIPTSASELKLKFKFDISDLSLKDIYENLIETVSESYERSLKILEKIEKRFVQFGNKIKKVFFDIYDKVVGRSYWPDMIDGVYDYTRNLVSTESLITKFTNKIKELFQNLSKSIIEKSGSFGEAFKEVLTNIGNIKVADISKALYSNISSAIVATIFLLSGNTTLKLLSATYFANLFNGAVFTALGAVGPGLAQLSGSALGEFSAKLAEGVVRGLDFALEALPNFVASFLAALNPLPEAIKDIFKSLYDVIALVMPGIGVLLQNNLIYGLITAGGLLAIFSKDIRKTLGSLVFGKTKKGQKTEDGLVDYLSAIVEKFVPIGGNTLGKIFESPKLALAGAAALSSSFLESISILEAAQIGIPLLAFALLGKDGGAAIVRDIAVLIEKVIFGVIRGGYSTAEKILGNDNLLIKAINTPFDLYQKAVSKFQNRNKSTTLSVLTTDLKQMFFNLKENAQRYGAGELNFWEALVFKPKDTKNPFNNFNPFSPKANTGVVDIGKSFADFIAPITNLQIGGKQIPDFFKGLYRDTKLGIDRVVLAIKSANIVQTFSNFTSQIFAGISSIVSFASKNILESLSILLNLVKNKFVIFSILTAGLSGFAFAASDASSALSVFSQGLNGTIVGITSAIGVIAAFIISLKSIDKYAKGVKLFREIQAGKTFEDTVEKRVRDFKQSAEFAFEKSRASDLKKFRTARAAEVVKETINIEKEGISLRNSLNKQLSRKERLATTILNKRRILDNLKLERDADVEASKNGGDVDVARFVKREQEIAKLSKNLSKLETVGTVAIEKRIDTLNKRINDNATKAARNRTRASSDIFDVAVFEANRKTQLEQSVAAFRAQEEKTRTRFAAIGSAASPFQAGLLNTKFYFEDLIDTMSGRGKIAFDKFKTSSTLVGKTLVNAFKVSPQNINNFSDSLNLAREGLKALATGDFKAGFGFLKESFPEISKNAKAIGAEIKTSVAAAFASLLPSLTSTQSFFQKLKALAIAAGTAIQTAVIAPLIALTKPILILTAKITAALAVVGALALYFFGPDDTQFLTKLEWVYDKVRSIFGLSAKTEGGRLLDILSQFKDIQVGGIKVDFRDIVKDVDFSKVTKEQFAVYQKLAEETKQTLDTLSEAAIRQSGKLTDAQLEELNRAKKEFTDFTVRLPQKPEGTISEGAIALEKQILFVDNSFWTLTKRLLGWKTGFELMNPEIEDTENLLYKIGNAFRQVSAFIKSFSITEAILTIFSGLTFGLIGRTIGLIIGGIFGPIGATVGALVGGFLGNLLYKLIAGIFSIIGKGFNVIRNVFNIAIEGWVYFFKNSIEGLLYAFKLANKKFGEETVQTTSGAIIGGLLGALGGPFGVAFGAAAGGAIANFIYKLNNSKIPPSPLAKESADKAKLAQEDLIKYSSFVPKDLDIQLRSLQRTYENAREDFNSIANRDVNPNIEGSFGAYITAYVKAVTALDKAERQFLRAAEAGGATAKRNFQIAELNKREKTLVKNLKDIGVSDFGKDNVNLIGTSQQLAEYEFYYARIKQLDDAITVTISENARKRFRVEREGYLKQIEALRERAASLSTESGFFKLTAETTGYSENFLRNIPNIKKDSKEISNLVEAIKRTEAKIATAGIDQVKPLTIEIWRAELQKLREELSQRITGSTWIDDINESLKRLVNLEISPTVYRKLGEGIKESLQLALTNLNTLNVRRTEQGLSTEERTKRELEFRAAEQGMDNFVKTLTVGALQSEKSLLGVSIITGKEIPESIGKSIVKQKKWNELIKQQFAEETAIALAKAEYNRTGLEADNQRVRDSFARLSTIQRRLNRLAETFTLDTLTGALSQFGVQIEGRVFANLPEIAKQELLATSIQIDDFKKDISELDIDIGNNLVKRFEEIAPKVKRAAEIVFNVTKDFGKSFVESLSNAGISSFGTLTEKAAVNFIKLNNELKVLQFTLDNTFFDLDSKDSVTTLLNKLKELEKKRRTLKELAEDVSQTFATRLSSFNEIFKTSLSDIDFSSFGVAFGLAAGDAGRTLKRELENVYSFGVTSFGQAGSDFLKSLEKLRQAGEYLTFFTDIRKTISDSFAEGAKAGFERLKNILPDLGFDFEEFRRLPKEQRRKLSTETAQLNLLERASELPRLTKPLTDILETFDGFNVQEVLTRFQTEFLKITKRNLEDVLQTPTEINTSALEENTKALREFVAAFTGQPVKETPVFGKGNATSISTLTLPKPDLQPIAENSSEEVSQAFSERLAEAFSRNRLELQTGVGQTLTRKENLRSFGLEPRAVNLANETQLAQFETLARGRKQAADAIKTASDEERVNLQISIDLYELALADLNDKILNGANKLKEVGANFAQSFADNLTSSLTDLLKGKADENKSVFETFLTRFLDNFTSTVIDTFVKGLMDPLTGKEGIITSLGQNLGKSIFEQGSKIFSKENSQSILSNKSEPLSTTEQSQTAPSFLNQLITSITNPLASIGAWILQLVGISSVAASSTKIAELSTNTLLTGINAQLVISNGLLTTIAATSATSNLTETFTAANAFGAFATGGLVKGPGTGTSDSITAMLSNGEFVVNADATKKHLGVLSSINSGRIKKFAEGGLVSTAILATPSMASIETPKSNSKPATQQVINLNITGDISRQTRSEIYQMLPSIAEGVNMHNKERGYR